MRVTLLALLLILLSGCQSGNPRVAGEPANSELVASLTQKFWAERERIVSIGLKPVDADKVDLTYDATAERLSWSYVNLGDYDQNGEVGIPDITQIALHYLHRVGDDAMD